MVMSRDPRKKFWNFLSCPNSSFNIKKSHKVSGSEGVENSPPPPVPLGLKALAYSVGKWHLKYTLLDI